MKRINLILAILLLTPILVFSQTARVQVIHNSADAAAASVDIYINGNIAVPELNYMEATPFVDLPADSQISIDVVPAGGDITSSVYNMPVTLTSGETYVLVANGIVSGSGYMPAPAFGIDVYAMGREMATNASNTDVLVVHGSTDAPTVDVHEVNAGQLSDDLMYGDFAGYLELPTDNYFLQLYDETGSTSLLAYDAPLADLMLDGAAITVVASGFLNPANNSDGPAFGLYAVTAAGGDFIPLPVSQARAQVVHNSADDMAEMVDVYLNGGLLLEDFAFRTATPFVDLPANVDVSIDIAPAGSMDVTESIYNLTTQLASDEKYIIVADGIVSGSGYDSAPAFGLEVFGMARESAMVSGNSDLLLHHGATDAPTVDIYETSAGELYDNLMYGDFSMDYLELPTDDYSVEIRLENGVDIVQTYDADLLNRGLTDNAMMIMASGFLNPANNSDGPAFGLYAVLADGTVAMLDPMSTTSLENETADIKGVALYPNPASDIANMQFELDKAADVKVSVFALNGQEVYNNTYRKIPKGTNRFILPVNQFTSGLYTVQFVTDNKMLRKKLHVVR
ncbi:MAG: DUF4397 domain-containing protein [Bacteroidota bacterium]